MKSKKLNLSELKVKSFVTDLESEKENTVKGGRIFTEINGCAGQSENFECPSVPPACELTRLPETLCCA